MHCFLSLFLSLACVRRGRLFTTYCTSCQFVLVWCFCPACLRRHVSSCPAEALNLVSHSCIRILPVKHSASINEEEEAKVSLHHHSLLLCTSPSGRFLLILVLQGNQESEAAGKIILSISPLSAARRQAQVPKPASHVAMLLFSSPS